jgi:hypothetical protein
MSTVSYPIGYEYENDEITKITEINPVSKTYALQSGNVAFAGEVISSVKEIVRQKTMNNVTDIAEAFRSRYQDCRRVHVIRNELEPRGLDIATYYKMHQQLLPGVVKIIDDALKGWNPQTGFIVAGKNGEECHIYNILSPGDISCADGVGYVSIGVGAPHVVYSLIEQGYKKSMSLDKGKDLVIKAKARAEVAPGVGKNTKIEVI